MIRFAKIEDYEDYYISDHGDVFTYRNGKTGYKGLRKLSLKNKNNPNRYIQVCLCSNGNKKYIQVHRLVAQYFCDGYFEGAVVNHKDGNKHNNHYSNLEWVSQKTNVNKSYISSGVGPKRNFCKYLLKSKNGEVLGEFYGVPDGVKFCNENGIQVSESAMKRNKKSNGYFLIKID